MLSNFYDSADGLRTWEPQGLVPDFVIRQQSVWHLGLWYSYFVYLQMIRVTTCQWKMCVATFSFKRPCWQVAAPSSCQTWLFSWNKNPLTKTSANWKETIYVTCGLLCNPQHITGPLPPSEQNYSSSKPLSHEGRCQKAEKNSPAVLS